MVHFYQFKNPIDASKGFPEGDVDKVTGGLTLILQRDHERIANEDLRNRIRDIYDMVPIGYRLHLVTSGTGIAQRTPQAEKLDSFVAKLNAPSDDFFRWDCIPLTMLQELNYAKSLPAVEDPIVFSTQISPYMVESGNSHCYLLHTSGGVIAELYQAHGDGLLQRNIRVSEGPTPTNRSILATCKGDESRNFLHYNNGVTFICDTATYDAFKATLTLYRAQVVNGGQTIRALHQSFAEGSLKPDVVLPLRVVTSNGDKDFGSNVAVNQNNQNQMRPSFLRSNDPRVMQLGGALASIGWYLERREGEVESLSLDERSAIEGRIGHSLEDHAIRLKDGSQAYVATFYRQPELAKKDPKKIFLSVEDGGQFERVFSSEMTAAKMVISHQIKRHIDSFVKRFTVVKRKRTRGADGWEAEYRKLLGDSVVDNHIGVIDQVVPTSSFFLCATVFREHFDILGKDPSALPGLLDSTGDETIRRHLGLILDYAKMHPEEANRSWPTLLKSNRFFSGFHSFLQGIHVGANGAGS